MDENKEDEKVEREKDRDMEDLYEIRHVKCFCIFFAHNSSQV